MEHGFDASVFETKWEIEMIEIKIKKQNINNDTHKKSKHKRNNNLYHRSTDTIRKYYEQLYANKMDNLYVFRNT